MNFKPYHRRLVSLAPEGRDREAVEMHVAGLAPSERAKQLCLPEKAAHDAVVAAWAAEKEDHAARKRAAGRH